MKTDFLENELQEIKNLGHYRTLRELDSPQGREILLHGKPVLNFCSNDYLGLAHDERLKQAAREAIDTYGLGAGASRLVCGNMAPHVKLEEDLAQLKQTQGALVYSSGYLANIGIIGALMDRHSVVLCDKFNHASILDGILLSGPKLLRYPHGDMQALRRNLEGLEATRRKLIVTESIFSMDGDKAPLEEIVALARQYGAMVMVDEAHAFGVRGAMGGGLVEELGLGTQIDIQMGTLSKAAGCMGAYACTTTLLRDYLINKSRSFIYTTALPPSLAHAARMAVQIIRESGQLRHHLQQNADYIRAQLRSMGFDTMNSSTCIIPLQVKDSLQAVAMAQRLLEQGIFLQAIRPPTVPQGTARLRLTVMATHTREDLDRLLNAMKKM